MTTLFRPMLAATAPDDLTQLRYPLLASAKLDGVRAIVRRGVVVSRKLKPIPSPTVQALFGDGLFDGLDGELIVGDPCAPDAFRRTTSAVMRRTPMSDEDRAALVFYVFDHTWNPTTPFANRIEEVTTSVHGYAHVEPVIHRRIKTPAELIAYEDYLVSRGHEGVMLRDPVGPYKQGRSTLREGWLMKLKRFVDSEAIVLDTVELFRNENAATTNALGYMERSHRKENRRGANTLGALKVRDLVSGVEFEIGSGFTQTDRDTFWRDRASLPGRVVRYHYFPMGSKDKPRLPIYDGFRDPIDL